MKMFTFIDGKERTVIEPFTGVFCCRLDNGDGDYVPRERCYLRGDNIGYRDDSLFGSGSRDPFEVCLFEIGELGNSDIPEYILEHYSGRFEESEKDFLRSIQSAQDVHIDRDVLYDILRKVIGGRDFCVWLCDRPEDVYASYVAPFPDPADMDTYLSTSGVVSYRIPIDAAVLADNGKEGKLYAWKA